MQEVEKVRFPDGIICHKNNVLQLQGNAWHCMNDINLQSNSEVMPSILQASLLFMLRFLVR